MRKIILLLFLFILISSKKFLGQEILSEDFNDNIVLQKAGFGGILPEAEENPNTNMDLIFDNIDFIKKVINNVKQNETDMKIKYNIK